MEKYSVAHIRKSDNIEQSVRTHLIETSQMAAKLDLPEAGELLGLMLDFGKYSTAFQEYIRAVTNQDPDVDNDYVLSNGQKIEHSTAGAQWIYRFRAAVCNKMDE